MKIANFILFQFAWFACVLGGANNYQISGALAVLAVLLIQLIFVENWKKEAQFLVLVGILGTLADSIPLYYGIYQFPHSSPFPWSYPIWLSALWVLFASTCHFSMSWLSRRYYLGILFGFFGGPLSYYAGARMNAVQFPVSESIALPVIGILWAIMMPIILYLSEKFR